MSPDKLKAKVTARNRVNDAIMTYAPFMREALRPFVGQKILNVNGQLLKKVATVLPALPDWPGLRAYYTTGSGYFVRCGFQASESEGGNGGTQYAEADAYLGDVTNGVLQAIYPNETYRTNFTCAEVNRLQDDLRAVKSRLDSIQSSLSAII